MKLTTNSKDLNVASLRIEYKFNKTNNYCGFKIL